MSKNINVEVYILQLKEPGIIVGVSNRHVHLSQEHLEVLFGENYELTPIKPLGQPGQYACDECVDLIGPKGIFQKVRILGPVRKESQVEISRTDSFKLGITPPVRDSGDIQGTPGITLKGPKGEVVLDKGVIIAKRHIHMLPIDAEHYGVKDKDIVSVYCNKEGRRLIFQDVLIRVSEKFALEFHVDIDEANAALLNSGDYIKIIERF
ncbi:phosphate propanoyltransferase [Petrotoga sp. 9PWA.NaAc.5.4]|uniref:phosphate propanoyltransferase n=1 Tax=Petrotoga sp. 9PWA.NaAc.5.4 TaxID=1434328 RepID=UPI00351316F3